MQTPCLSMRYKNYHHIMIIFYLRFAKHRLLTRGLDGDGSGLPDKNSDFIQVDPRSVVGNDGRLVERDQILKVTRLLLLLTHSSQLIHARCCVARVV
jgi:hypothetical protein